MKKSILAAVATVTLCLSPAAHGQEQVLKYRASVAGIPLGKLKLFLDRSGEDYTAKARFSMVSVLRTIFNGDAEAQVFGRFDGDRAVPETFDFDIEKRDGTQKTRIAFDETGNPIDLRAKPPLRQRSYSMTLDQAAGAVDPATAIMLLSAPRPDPCTLSFDVFDGAKRHRISLTGLAETPAGDGRALCIGLYERIAGFKDKYMTPDSRTYPFKAKLLRNGGAWIPEQIWADTKFGPASATLDR